jgi:hypothetical protein
MAPRAKITTPGAYFDCIKKLVRNSRLVRYQAENSVLAKSTALAASADAPSAPTSLYKSGDNTKSGPPISIFT